MKDMILLPTGDKIRADEIMAIRLGDAQPADEFCKVPMFPRVIIDFGQSHVNTIICECKTNDERDALAMALYREWKGARDEVNKAHIGTKAQFKHHWCYGKHQRAGQR